MGNNLSAVLYGPRDLRVEGRPCPQPAPGEVLVAVQAVGVCGSDVHYFETGRVGDFVVEAPMVLGHESAGVIVDAGDEAGRTRIGTLVALEPGIPCGRCLQCRTGRYNLCPDVRFFATPPVDGSMCEFVAVPSEFAHPVPEGMHAVAAAMAEPVSVGLWACRKAGVRPGDRVLITGAGPVGLLTAQVAVAQGATEVAVADVNRSRLETAVSLRLRPLEPLDADTALRFDVLIECSGSPAALSVWLPSVAPAGRVIIVGMGADDVSIPISILQSRELIVAGTFRYANTYPAALDLISSESVLVEPIVTHHFPIHRAQSAVTVAKEVPNALKAVVHPADPG